MYEREILEVYSFCDVRSFPIDCDSIISRLGYRIETYQHVANGDKKRLIELMRVSNDAFIIRRTHMLYINENADRRRQRFSKCHEIGHIVLLSDDEDEADNFASNILAPLPIVKMYGLKTADEISKRFDISISAANHVISEIRKNKIADTYGICDYFRQIETERKVHVPLMVERKKHRSKARERIDRLIDERSRFLADNPQNIWTELQLAKMDTELYCL